MDSKIVSSMLDELTKIATGLAPAGAPTVNSKGAGLAPKLPKITGLGKPGGPATSMTAPAGGGLGKMGEAFFNEVEKIANLGAGAASPGPAAAPAPVQMNSMQRALASLKRGGAPAIAMPKGAVQSAVSQTAQAAKGL